MSTPPPAPEAERLAGYARDLARQFEEPALVVLSPPPSSVSGTLSATPYAVLLSQATPAEIASPGTRLFSRRGRELPVAALLRARRLKGAAT